MSEMIVRMLERLAEMFPKQNYQDKLESYLLSKGISSPADVDYWINQYEQEQAKERGSLWAR